MIRSLSILALLFSGFSTLWAQEVAFNTTLRDQLQYTQDLNDIWGYAAPDGTEYALVGTRTGLSIVSLADPDDIEELFFIPGDLSTWRDMKTYGDYAYVTTDTGDDGLLIVDLSDLPNSAPFEYQNLGIAGSTEILLTAHNLYIDETTGIVYISGGNYNGGGMVLYDLDADPANPAFLNAAPNIYSHDVYVQDGLMYASEIFQGRLAIYDVSDPQNITLVGERETPFFFTHNAWTTASGSFVFTTDERANAPTAAYDITDPTDPILLDEFRPDRSVGQGVIPHNVHVLDEYLIISHYTDGLEIVDASQPDNLVEVSYYDTWTGGPGGFNGCWGAYPFLPSGLVLATDISNGLFVVEVDYQRAARLVGRVTSVDGNNLNNVNISLSGPTSASTNTDATGNYRAGVAGSGSYEVEVSLPGFQTFTTNIDLTSGETDTLDVELEPLPVVSLTGQVIDTDGNPIPDADVLITGFHGTFTRTSDANGNVSVAQIFAAEFTVFAGKWGYLEGSQDITAGNGFTISLPHGYQDGFVVDQGWDTDSDDAATTGFWVRAVPNGTNGGASNPGVDVADDLGDRAYVTGNSSSGGVGSDDIDDGTVFLTSPEIDPDYLMDSNLRVSYDFWFYNAGGNGNPDDELTVGIDQGNGLQIVNTYSVAAGTPQSQWVADSFNLADLPFDVSGPFRFVIAAEDTGEGHLSEAGLDDFRVVGLTQPSTSNDPALIGLELETFPNPSSEQFNVRYRLPNLLTDARLELGDVFGRTLRTYDLSDARTGNLELGGDLPPGTYVLQLLTADRALHTQKLIKQ